MKRYIADVVMALKRCKVWFASVFITYCLSCLIGIIMVHTGNRFALSWRDKIVGNALEHDQAAIDHSKGNNYPAVLKDFCSNLFIGAIPQTVMGLGVVIPYATVTYQGWIGGIVSVDGKHESRLAIRKSALYYIIVLLLQFIPYSLAIGSGIRAGIETYRANKNSKIFNYKIDKASLMDVLRIYSIVVILFLIASSFEFLSAWNV